MAEQINDVVFKLNSGTYNGESYGFTLALVDNKKAWECRKIPREPPSMVEEEIEMVLTARDEESPLGAHTELARAADIMEQIQRVADETTASTLTGIDGVDRGVLIRQHALTVEMHETEKDPEYQIKVACYGLHS
jgi:hypothetical protein